MAGIIERLRAPIDSTVTKARYHSEVGYFPRDIAEIDDPSDPARAVIHYRSWGAIMHVQNAEGKLLERVEGKSGKDLIEARGLIMPKTSLELRAELKIMTQFDLNDPS